MTAVSRSQERGAIAGCSGKAPTQTYSNGQLPTSILCVLPFASRHRLRADAAVRLIRLNDVYRGKFGENLCLTDSYRSLASQYSVAARKPGLAARPGTSEHGWGLAIDVCDGPDQTSSARRDLVPRERAEVRLGQPGVGPAGHRQPPRAVALGVRRGRVQDAVRAGLAGQQPGSDSLDVAGNLVEPEPP